MDDTTQNPNQVTQDAAQVPQASVLQQDSGQVMPVAPVPTSTQAPVDPMDNAQVPDLPTAPVAPDMSSMSAAPVMPSADPVVSDTSSGQTFQQGVPSSDSGQAEQAMQQMAAAQPAPVPDPAVEPQSQVDGTLAQVAPAPSVGDNDMASLGPVTMEDLMEELQHIEDKLDEMDEKL